MMAHDPIPIIEWCHISSEGSRWEGYCCPNWVEEIEAADRVSEAAVTDLP